MNNEDVQEIVECGRKAANYYLQHGYRLIRTDVVTRVAKKSDGQLYIHRHWGYVMGRPAERCSRTRAGIPCQGTPDSGGASMTTTHATDRVMADELMRQFAVAETATCAFCAGLGRVVPVAVAGASGEQMVLTRDQRAFAPSIECPDCNGRCEVER